MRLFVIKAAVSLEFPLCKTARHLNSFLPHTLAIFDALPSAVVSAPSLSVFLQHIDNHFAYDKFCFGLSV